MSAPSVPKDMKQIWLGPLLGSNRTRLLDRCVELVSSGHGNSFLYLAASQPLLESVTERILQQSVPHGLWGELPVVLFRGFVRRIVQSGVDAETGLPLNPLLAIDREELPLKRSLVSQLLARLKAEGKLKAIAPLAASEGCINTVVKLLGELQRSAKSAAELNAIIDERSKIAGDNDASVPLQIDFDREVALIYEAYTRALNESGLTEEDADQFRALSILQGELDGKRVAVPWVGDIKLLILDGFFDFTPVQGEMLRRLIPQVSEVIVNLNHDEANPEIFRAFSETIEQLHGIDSFSVVQTAESEQLPQPLSELRTKLFNSALAVELPDAEPVETEPKSLSIQLFECTDRETEIRAVAKEIKRLLFFESFGLNEIALVVRERESYAETIVRVMREEGLPTSLERRLEATEIPAVRAARKLFQLLVELEDESAAIKISTIADLIKSEYFRLPDSELQILTAQFNHAYTALLRLDADDPEQADPEREERLKFELGICRWEIDSLENVIAYVGGELRVNKWLERAGQLLARWPQVKITKQLAAPDPAAEQNGDDDSEDEVVDADRVEADAKDTEKKQRPARDVHPAAIAWSSLVVLRIAEAIRAMPREGEPVDLRLAVLRLLEQLEFARQVRRPLRREIEESEIPNAMLDLRGLEALRRSFVAAIKSFAIVERALPRATEASKVTLSAFLGEVSRALGTQLSTGTGGPPGGLKVLAATDVRGLRYRAIFIAGLVEGGFPLRASRDWIYPHEERERLKKFGLTLEDISPATLLKEEHYFYQAACRATERLYLLRPLWLEADTETVASYYIAEVRRAIAPAQLPSEEKRRDFDGKKLYAASNPSELARSLLRQEQRQLQGLEPKQSLETALAWALERQYLSGSAMRRIAIERERDGFEFGPFDGLITNPNLQAMLAHKLSEDTVHSASGLSMFGNCPYRFFASRVLKLEPRGEAALDLQALDAGKLLHDVLRRFFERHRGEHLRRQDLPSLRAELAQLADEVFDEHQRVVPPLNPKIWKIDREIRKILLDQVLLFEMGVQEKSKQDVRPVYFELAFGIRANQPADPNSSSEYLELARQSANGEDKVRIQGQIDRVDEASDGTLIAYDYKLSTGHNADDMVTGRTLQVPIYLEALERLFFPDRQIAGGGYYTIRGDTSRRNRGIYRADFAEYTGITSRVSVSGDREWQRIRDDAIARIWEFFDRMRAGDFRVDPSKKDETCKFCDFPAVCRYERFRIERKRR